MLIFGEIFTFHAPRWLPARSARCLRRIGPGGKDRQGFAPRSDFLDLENRFEGRNGSPKKKPTGKNPLQNWKFPDVSIFDEKIDEKLVGVPSFFQELEAFFMVR